MQEVEMSAQVQLDPTHLTLLDLRQEVNEIAEITAPERRLCVRIEILTSQLEYLSQ